MRIGLVGDVCRFGQYDKAVSESFGNEKLQIVFSRQFRNDVPAEAGRAGSDIQRNIGNASADNPHEFGLGMSAFLKVQSPQRADLRKRCAVLNEFAGDALSEEVSTVVGLQKVAAGIAKYGGFDEQQIGNGCWNNLHDGWFDLDERQI